MPANIDPAEAVDVGTDPWTAIRAWRAGRCSIDALAANLADAAFYVPYHEPGEVWDLHLDSQGAVGDGAERGPEVSRWWAGMADTLTDVGFGAADFDAVLRGFVPRLEPHLLERPPVDARDRLDPGPAVTPRARVYLDVDGVFSPICPQRQAAVLLESFPPPVLHVDGAPDTGWSWEMCTLGLGPTPVPVELTASLVALDAAGIEVVWVTTWYERANWLLPIAGVDSEFRAPRADVWDVDHWKWAFVSAETRRDGVPSVWIDDREVGPSTWAWATEHSSPPRRLMRPNRFHGLTPDDWATILDWLEDTAGCDVSAARRAAVVALPQRRQ